jgi:hypothetical protein
MRLDPDIVVFDRFMTEEQFGWRVEEQCPNALRVLETSDLHCLREARQQLLKDRCRFGSTFRPLQGMAQQDITMREIAAIFRCDISLMISRFEMELLTRCFSVPELLLLYCPFLLDMPDSKTMAQFSQREHFVSYRQFPACTELGCCAMVKTIHLASHTHAIAASTTAYLWRIHATKST